MKKGIEINVERCIEKIDRAVFVILIWFLVTGLLAGLLGEGILTPFRPLAFLAMVDFFLWAIASAVFLFFAWVLIRLDSDSPPKCGKIEKSDLGERRRFLFFVTDWR